METSVLNLLHKFIGIFDVLLLRQIDASLESQLLQFLPNNFSFLGLLDGNDDLFQNSKFSLKNQSLKTKIGLFKQKLTGFLNFVSLLTVNFEQCVFLFNRKRELVFLHEPPYNLMLQTLSKQLLCEESLLNLNDIFHSKPLLDYVDLFLENEEHEQSNILNSGSILIKPLFGKSSNGQSSFYVVIDAETFINLELGNRKKELDSKNYQKEGKKLKNEKMKLVGLISYEILNGKNGKDKNQTYKISKQSSLNVIDAKEDNENDVDEENDDVGELPVDKKKLISQKARALRHSVSGASESNKALFRNKPSSLYKRANSLLYTRRQFYESIKNSYAMEFLPQYFELNDKKEDRQATSILQAGGLSPSHLMKRIKSKNDAALQDFVEQTNVENVEEIEKTIEELTLVDWSFDIISQHEVSDFALIMRIFRPHLSALNIDQREFLTFAVRSKFYYNHNNNPFHNFKHGVSVLFSANHFFVKINFLKDNFPERLHFAFLLAAFGHDLDHTGRNNVFEINTRSKLAMNYNDQSPLEQHHIRTLFKIINLSENSILKGFSFEEYFEVRNLIIECILATDMKVHFALVKKFEGLVEEPKGLSLKERKSLVLNLVIHSADISGSAKNIEVARVWSQMISVEFTNQLAFEIRNGVPVTPYFKDLNIEINLWKSEISFLRFIVKPLFELLGKYDFDLREDKSEDSPIKKQADKYYGKINEIINTNVAIYEVKIEKSIV